VSGIVLRRQLAAIWCPLLCICKIFRLFKAIHLLPSSRVKCRHQFRLTHFVLLWNEGVSMFCIYTYIYICMESVFKHGILPLDAHLQQQHQKHHMGHSPKCRQRLNGNSGARLVSLGCCPCPISSIRRSTIIVIIISFVWLEEY